MKKIKLILLAIILASAAYLPAPVLAASATLYLSPSSRSVAEGSTLTVSVRENSGSAKVDGVQANLTYPADKLDFVSIGSSSAFAVAAQNSGGSGSVKIARGALPAVSGDQLVATVTFRAKVDSGSATITFASGSGVTYAGSYHSLSKGSGTYSLTKPAPAPKEAPKDTKAPTIKSVSVSNISHNKATVSWQTNEPATTEVSYGLNQKYGLSYTNKKLVTKHTAVLNSPLISPATTYHFVVRSADAAGNKAASKDSLFKTSGSTVVITVVDKDGNPIAEALVTIYDQQASTDENGQVTLTDLPLGKVHGIVEYDGQQQIITADIVEVGTAEKPQTATVTIQPVTQSSWVSLAAILLLALAAFAFWRYVLPLIRKKTKPPTPLTPAAASTTPKPQVISPVIKPDDKNPPPPS